MYINTEPLICVMNEDLLRVGICPSNESEYVLNGPILSLFTTHMPLWLLSLPITLKWAVAVVGSVVGSLEERYCYGNGAVISLSNDPILSFPQLHSSCC